MLAERGRRSGTALEALRSALLYQLSYRVRRTKPRQEHHLDKLRYARRGPQLFRKHAAPALARSRRSSAVTTERTLVERMGRGDEAAFRDLLARYRNTMYATAYAVLADPEEVDATVADAFAEARRTAAGFLDSLGTVSGWLTHLTRLCIAARLPTGRPET